MPSFNLNKSASLLGVSAPPQQISVADNMGLNIGDDEQIAAAQPATLTTRTNGTSGSLTMTNSGHGITTGQRVDLYWDGGQCYGAVVGTVAGTTVPIASVDGGTALPAATTAINVGIPTQFTITVTGDNLTALLLAAPSKGYFVFRSSAPATLLASLVSAGGEYDWYAGSGVTNPLAGVTVASVWVSHNNTAGVQNMLTGLLYH